jgi:hypothetical protein
MTPEEHQERFLQAIRDGADVYMSTDDYNCLPKQVADGNADAAIIWMLGTRVHAIPFLERGQMVAMKRRKL